VYNEYDGYQENFMSDFDFIDKKKRDICDYISNKDNKQITYHEAQHGF
jgi:hypothetical protein